MKPNKAEAIAARHFQTHKAVPPDEAQTPVNGAPRPAEQAEGAETGTKEEAPGKKKKRKAKTEVPSSSLFELRSNGVYFIDPDSDKGATLVCGRLEIIAFGDAECGIVFAQYGISLFREP